MMIDNKIHMNVNKEVLLTFFEYIETKNDSKIIEDFYLFINHINKNYMNNVDNQDDDNDEFDEVEEDFDEDNDIDMEEEDYSNCHDDSEIKDEEFTEFNNNKTIIDTCPICMDDDKKLYSTRCGKHYICITCQVHLLKERCPICRQ